MIIKAQSSGDASDNTLFFFKGFEFKVLEEYIRM